MAQYKVMLELLPKYQEHADALSLLYLKSPGGEAGAAQRDHQGDPRRRTAEHQPFRPASFGNHLLQPEAGIRPGRSGDEVKDLADRTLPARINTSFTGTAQAFQSSLKNLSLLLIIAVFVVYIVLGILYESYVHPLTILSGLPSAGFGALLTLMVFKVDLSIYAFVGLMMLVGIVKKNAIMQIDCAQDAERRFGKSPAEAIYEGCMTRFRPIMMTTMAAMLGAMPMAIGYGSGSEARRPLGLTVVGGLIFSQMVTLYLTPVVYTYLAAIQERFKKWRHGRGVAQGRLAPVEP